MPALMILELLHRAEAERDRAVAALSRVLVAALGCECQDGHACHVHGDPLGCVDRAVGHIDDTIADNMRLADEAECIHSRLTARGIEEHESGVSRVGPGEGNDPGPRRDLLERVDMLLDGLDAAREELEEYIRATRLRIGWLEEHAHALEAEQARARARTLTPSWNDRED
ncbi:MAG: hypothetical protein AMXMBFR64_60860 [Myxococcales bacterium]